MGARRSGPAVGLILLILLTACTAPTTGSPTRTPQPAIPEPTATAASAPSLRVPTTCDVLAPAALASAAAAADVRLLEWSPTSPSPVEYSDSRAGALICEYQGNGSPASPRIEPDVFVGVLPTLGHNEGFGDSVGEVGIAVTGDEYFSCPASYPNGCFFGAIIGGYQLTGTVQVADRSVIDAAQARRVFDTAESVVRSLAEPAPLWEPAGGSLRGAWTAQELATEESVAAALGVPSVRVIRGEGGEYAISRLLSTALSGTYWATYADDNRQAIVSIAVLPGGASFYDEAKRRPLTGTTDVHAVTGVGDDAYLSTFRPTVSGAPGDPIQYFDVKVKNSWVQVSDASPAVLEQLAREVIANLS